jgi:hypothetical protein
LPWVILNLSLRPKADQDERWRRSNEITPDGLSPPHHSALVTVAGHDLVSR